MNWKFILLPVFVAVVTGCSGTYGSKFEAEQACLQWESKEKKYTIDENIGFGVFAAKKYQKRWRGNRNCQYEKSQIIGKEFGPLWNKQSFKTIKDFRKGRSWKVVKYFRYRE